MLATKTLVLISSFLHVCTATDTIRQGESMNSSETMVSPGGIFELGFLIPGQSKNIYLGIWYKKISIPNRTTVWVANRKQPISKLFSSSCSLSINKDGNLIISYGQATSLTVTSVSRSRNTSATFLDTRNLILRDNNNSDVVLWQSFDYPSDTLLPEMKIGFNRSTGITWSLTSWSSFHDPSPGAFSFIQDSSLEFLIMNGSQRYWTAGKWNGFGFSLAPEMRLSSTQKIYYYVYQTGAYFTYSLNNVSLVSRLEMDLSGQLKEYEWIEDTKKWNLSWVRPVGFYKLVLVQDKVLICEAIKPKNKVDCKV